VGGRFEEERPGRAHRGAGEGGRGGHAGTWVADGAGDWIRWGGRGARVGREARGSRGRAHGHGEVDVRNIFGRRNRSDRLRRGG
jgi:hypothetical protein